MLNKRELTYFWHSACTSLAASRRLSMSTGFSMACRVQSGWKTHLAGPYTFAYASTAALPCSYLALTSAQDIMLICDVSSTFQSLCASGQCICRDQFLNSQGHELPQVMAAVQPNGESTVTIYDSLHIDFVPVLCCPAMSSNSCCGMTDDRPVHHAETQPIARAADRRRFHPGTGGSAVQPVHLVMSFWTKLQHETSFCKATKIATLHATLQKDHKCS